MMTQQPDIGLSAAVGVVSSDSYEYIPTSEWTALWLPYTDRNPATNTWPVPR